MLLKIPFEEIEPAKVKESVGVWEYESMGIVDHSFIKKTTPKRPGWFSIKKKLV